MYAKILVPLDGSKLAEKALPYALRLASLAGGKVTLLRCVPHTQRLLASADFDSDGYDDVERIDREVAERYLQMIAERPDVAGFLQAVTTPCGRPAEEILDFALIDRSDLIVISSHGRSGLERFVFGSVAERVVRHSPCPVMVVGASLELLDEEAASP